jgi:hypothetical protein
VIEKILKDVLLTPLLQAIVNLVFTRYIAFKIFLTVFVLSSCALSSYLVIESITAYFRYEVSTTSRTIYEVPSLFPKVTFCNLNWFATQYAYELTQLGIFNDNTLLTEEKKKLGHDINDTLLYCKFNNKPCYSSEFTWSFDEDYGNCYTFNSNKSDLKKSNIAGPQFGLYIRIYVNVYEKLINLASKVNGWNGLCAMIRIGNTSYLTDNLDDGILVSSGFQTFLKVSRQFKSILPKP